MNAYWPEDLNLVWLTVALLAGMLGFGFAAAQMRSVLFAWALVVGGTTFIDRALMHAPPGFRMLALCGTLLFGMKAVVSAAESTPLRPLVWLGFATLWPGMRPRLFATAGSGPLPGAAALLQQGLKRIGAGLALVLLARQLANAAPSAMALAWLATAALLAGLSLLVHFGLFNVAAGLWRLAGVDCRPLFRAPLAARSLGDFWGRRWNLAFCEMTTVAVYRPVAARCGRPTATCAAFLFSGLLHELAISVPVQAGYGLPTLYFALHGGLVLVEQALERRGWAITRLGWLAHVWTLAWLALPLPLLFHPWFLEGVVWPIVGLNVVLFNY